MTLSNCRSDVLSVTKATNVNIVGKPPTHSSNANKDYLIYKD